MSDIDALTILHVTAPGEFGGLERVLHGLAVGLVGRGHDIHVAAVLDRHRPEPRFLQTLREGGVHVHPVLLPRRAYLRERAEIRRLCVSLAPDVVHTHSDRPDVIDAPVARRLGIPTVTTLHGSSKMGGKATFYEWLQLRALRRFDGVIAVATPLVREAADYGVAPERVHLIRNGWSPRHPLMDGAEARRALGVPNDVPVIGWVGRLIPVKGAEVFIEALALTRSPAWRAVVIGDGPTRESVESLARARRLERVSFLGAITDAALYYTAFDVFVLSSHSEGTPITILEAMAARVPIVATRVGGIPDMLENTGAKLVSPDAPAALATAIDAVIAQPEARSAMTEHAAERLARQYGLESWLAAHERLYRNLAARGRRRVDRRRTTNDRSVTAMTR